MKIVKSLEKSHFLIKRISETTKNKTKEQKSGFISILLGILAASILGFTLARNGVIRAGEGVIRAAQNFSMLPHCLTNFGIQNYYQDEPKFNGVYSKNNFPEIKDGTYIINLDKFESLWILWIVLCMNAETVAYFDSLGVKYISKEIRNKNWK